MHWFIDPIQYRYADFSGRATRQEFWMFFLWVFGIAASALVLSLFAERMLWTLVIVFLLTVVLPGSALVVRRLHDIGHFGWWSLLCLIPYLGLIVIALCALPGQSGSNRYGQPITDLGDVG